MVKLKISHTACCGTRIGRKKHGLANAAHGSQNWGATWKWTSWVLIFQVSKNISDTLTTHQPYGKSRHIIWWDQFFWPRWFLVKHLRSRLGYPVQIRVGGTMHGHIVQRCGTSRSKQFRLVGLVRNMIFQSHSTPLFFGRFHVILVQVVTHKTINNWG